MSTRDLLRRGGFHVVAQSACRSATQEARATCEERWPRRASTRQSCATWKLRRLISGLEVPSGRTVWSDYDRTHSYEEADLARKMEFVRRAAATRRWKLAWDLGANTGTFSRLVEAHTDYMVAMDGDWKAVENLYQREKAGKASRSILPLVVNLADPSPSQGWLGLERKDLAARGRPDLTLCLALVHHIVISANIPLADFIRWLASLGTSLIIEFVGRDDEMVQTLLANKEDQYDDYPVFRNLAVT